MRCLFNNHFQFDGRKSSAPVPHLPILNRILNHTGTQPFLYAINGSVIRYVCNAHRNTDDNWQEASTSRYRPTAACAKPSLGRRGVMVKWLRKGPALVPLKLLGRSQL